MRNELSGRKQMLDAYVIASYRAMLSWNICI
jgi:hypothetical protein